MHEHINYVIHALLLPVFLKNYFNLRYPYLQKSHHLYHHLSCLYLSYFLAALSVNLPVNQCLYSISYALFRAIDPNLAHYPSYF